MRPSTFLALIFCSAIVSFAAEISQVNDASGASGAEDAYGRLPLYFVENQGQVDDEIAFYLHGSGKILQFTPSGVTYVLIDGASGKPDSSREAWVVKQDFVGARPVVPVAGEERQATFNYFKGPPQEWKIDLPAYNRIVYPDLWPGIDLVYSGTIGRLKYEFVVKPGGDPKRIRLAFRGTSDLEVNSTGALQVTTPVASFEDGKPVAYQVREGKRVEVSMGYQLDPKADERSRPYGFELGAYDPELPLILDPALYVYCGFIGGHGDDRGYGIAADSEGHAFVTGYSDSTHASFPVKVGPYLLNNGHEDAFIAKVSQDGKGLEYCGFIGGNYTDRGQAVAVDQQGCAYVTGLTDSEGGTFPLFEGPDLTYNGYGDTFVAKISADGSQLIYCGYIGGENTERGFGIDVDAEGCAYIAGDTRSDETTFPVMVGPSLVYPNVLQATFVAKVNAQGTDLDFCGYIAHGFNPVLSSGSDVAVDSACAAYLCGYIFIPNTVGYALKVDPAGTHLVYHTCFGQLYGSESTYATAIAVDMQGKAHVTGWTHEDETTFPVTIGPDLTYNGSADAFVARLMEQGDIDYCGYIGGSDSDAGRGIAVDHAGRALITGETLSTEATLPVTLGPDTTFNGGPKDGFVTRVNADGTGLDYCGYIGGDEWDYPQAIATDRFGHAYVTGETKSDQATFPVTLGPDLTHNSANRDYDAFVTRVAMALAADAHLISAGTGGSIDLDLNASADHASRYYVILGSVSGTSPGFVLPGGLTMPLNWDWFTELVRMNLNTGHFVNFMSRLDDIGHERAQFNVPNLPSSMIGTSFYLAYTLYGPCDFVSNPVEVAIVP
jgi:hypothetical protein